MTNNAKNRVVIDMFGNIQDLMNIYQQLKQNPVSTLAKFKYNIPQGMNDPNQIMQHLLNTQQVNQQQVNNAAQNGNNPYVKQMFGFR